MKHFFLIFHFSFRWNVKAWVDVEICGYRCEMENNDNENLGLMGKYARAAQVSD